MKELFDIDLVYTWVDGNDLAWRRKHDAFTGVDNSKKDDDCKGRYADNDELRYSLRAAELYAPWIRKIFIVTDNQIPEWLDTSNPRVRVVDHKEIIPKEGLPCFNSQVIEHCLSRIPDLSEHFLYANDDMFFNREVYPIDFFADDGFPLVRLTRSHMRGLMIWMKEKLLRRGLSRYNMALRNASRLVKHSYGKYYYEKTHHNIDAYLRSDCLHVLNKFEKEIVPTLSNHLRGIDDIQRIVYSYVGLAEGRAHKVYVGKETSFMLRIHKWDRYKSLEEKNPKFFCLNDSQYASDADRVKVREFLKERFPNKSSFEK